MSYAMPAGVPVRRSRGPAERAIDVAMLVVFLVIGAAVAAIGLVAAAGPALGWYPATPRVTWAPPPGVLSTVRAVLLLALGVAEWLVWMRRRDRRVGAALGLFVAQQAITAIWPVMFWAGYGLVGLPDLWICFGLLLVLDLVVTATLLAFWPISRIAAVVVALHLASSLLSTALVLGSAGMHAVL